MQLKIVAPHQNPSGVPDPNPIWRAQDFVAGLVLPELLAGRGLKGVQRSITRTHEHFAFQDKGRRFNRAAGFESPNFFAIREIQSVEVAIERADEDAAF